MKNGLRLKGTEMILLALVFPCIYFLFTGRILRAIIALILMCTGFGWPIASIWAVLVRNDAVVKKNIQAAVAK